MKLYLSLACALSIFVLPPSSFAQAPETANPFDRVPSLSASEAGITENSVRAFIDAVNSAHLKSLEEFKLFMDRHYSDDVQITSNDTLAMADFNPRPKTTVSNKRQVMNGLKDTYDILQGASLKNEIRDIHISRDRKSAVVKDFTAIDTITAMPDSPGVKMHFISSGPCETTIGLNENNILQIRKMTCTSKTQVIPQQ